MKTNWIWVIIMIMHDKYPHTGTMSSHYLMRKARQMLVQRNQTMTSHYLNEESQTDISQEESDHD